MKLIHGECLEELKKMEDKSVDCFILDLPYGTTDYEWDKKINMEELWIEMKRTAKSKRTPYFFFCDFRLAVEIYNSNPKMFKYDIVISKRNIVGHLQSKYRPMRKHELLLVFYDKQPTYNVMEYHVKVEENNYKNDDNEYDCIYGNIMVKKKFGRCYEPPLPHSIFQMDNLNTRGRHHPTEKSQDILQWIIKYFSNEGDTILDATMGSGSCGVACKALNRNFIGIELEKEYFDVAENRINNITINK